MYWVAYWIIVNLGGCWFGYRVRVRYAQFNWDVANVDAILLNLCGKHIPREV